MNHSKDDENQRLQKVKFPTQKLPPLEEVQTQIKDEWQQPKVKFPTQELILPKEEEDNPEIDPTSKDNFVYTPYQRSSFRSSPRTSEDRAEENVPQYLEAHDLYTPMFPKKDEPEEEKPEEEPLIAETYIPPYNIFEELVEIELNLLLSRYIDICRCAQCRSDVVALSLQQLPAYYVTGKRGTEIARRIIAAKYMQRVMNAVNKSVQVVFRKPRKVCQKVKQVLWIRPMLEEAETEPILIEPPLFAKEAEKEPELHLSKEIEELIALVEEAKEEGNDLDLKFSEEIKDLPEQLAKEKEADTLEMEEKKI